MMSNSQKNMTHNGHPCWNDRTIFNFLDYHLAYLAKRCFFSYQLSKHLPIILIY